MLDKGGLKPDGKICMRPVGLVRTEREEPIDDKWGSLISVIELDSEQFDERAVAGLSEFSHLCVIFHFNKVSPDDVIFTGKQPRGLSHLPTIGIFAQRAKERPNRLGLSCCKLLSVDKLRLTVRGLDAIDGTPVLDIKPYMQEFSPREETSQPGWVREVMRDYYE
jgi:tRNA-Thr(GGU) m(6)t(6)A37 methyltransferase TsaA